MNPFSLPFMQTAVACSLLGGTALSILGVFILLRRVAFSGLAVSQLAALGSVVGLLIGMHLVSHSMALVFVVIGLGLLAWFGRLKFVPQDAWVASLYILGAGLSVLVLAKAPLGEAETMSVFFGNVLSLGTAEIRESAALLAVVVLVLGLWFRRWVWLSFDNISPEVSGLAVNRWTMLFYGLFALGMTVSIHLFGVLLAFSYLLLPGILGLILTRRLRRLFLFIPASTVTATVAGFYFSFRWDFPTGPFVATLMAAAVLLAGLYRSLRPRAGR